MNKDNISQVIFYTSQDYYRVIFIDGDESRFDPSQAQYGEIAEMLNDGFVAHQSENYPFITYTPDDDFIDDDPFEGVTGIKYEACKLVADEYESYPQAPEPVTVASFETAQDAIDYCNEHKLHVVMVVNYDERGYYDCPTIVETLNLKDFIAKYTVEQSINLDFDNIAQLFFAYELAHTVFKHLDSTDTILIHRIASETHIEVSNNQCTVSKTGTQVTLFPKFKHHFIISDKLELQDAQEYNLALSRYTLIAQDLLALDFTIPTGTYAYNIWQ